MNKLGLHRNENSVLDDEIDKLHEIVDRFPIDGLDVQSDENIEKIRTFLNELFALVNDENFKNHEVVPFLDVDDDIDKYITTDGGSKKKKTKKKKNNRKKKAKNQEK